MRVQHPKSICMFIKNIQTFYNMVFMLRTAMSIKCLHLKTRKVELLSHFNHLYDCFLLTPPPARSPRTGCVERCKVPFFWPRTHTFSDNGLNPWPVSLSTALHVLLMPVKCQPWKAVIVGRVKGSVLIFSRFCLSSSGCSGAQRLPTIM